MRLFSTVILNVFAIGLLFWVVNYDYCVIKKSTNFGAHFDKGLIFMAIIFQVIFFIIMIGLINSLFNYFSLVNAFVIGAGRRVGLYLAPFILVLCSISMVLNGAIGESNKLEKSKLMDSLFNLCCYVFWSGND